MPIKPGIRFYESDQQETEFDKSVNRLVWFSVACLIIGIIVSHYAH